MPGNNLPNNVWFTGTKADGINPANLMKVNSANKLEVGDGINPLILNQIATPVDIDAQNGTLLAASIASGLIVHTSTGGGGTLTFDTGANLDAAFPEWVIGTVRTFYLVNDGNQTDTLAVAAGVTIANVANTIVAGDGAIIVLRKTAAATYVAYIIN